VFFALLLGDAATRRVLSRLVAEKVKTTACSTELPVTKGNGMIERLPHGSIKIETL
jgi:hypothetical protein